MSEQGAFSPEWLTPEVEQALAQITGRYARKKRTTILRLAEGAIVGRSMTETLRRKDTCSQATWWGQYTKGEKVPGWAEDPVVAQVLELALESAQRWEDARIARGIAQVQHQLAEHAPAAELRLFQLALGANRQSLQRQAALDILDRLGVGEVMKMELDIRDERITNEQRDRAVSALADVIAATLHPDGPEPDGDLDA